MTLFDYEENLARVQRAIMKIETEGEVVELEFDGVKERVTKTSLPILYKREAFLRRMLEREQRGSGITYGVPK